MISKKVPLWLVFRNADPQVRCCITYVCTERDAERQRDRETERVSETRVKGGFCFVCERTVIISICIAFIF